VKSKPLVAPVHLEALRRFKADVFQVLAHPTRIHIIETLRQGELSVGAILDEVKVEQANISQHLALLRAKRLVNSRKAKNQVLYSLKNPLLTEVLDTMRRYFLIHLQEDSGMLHTMEQESRPRAMATKA
jgi:DNA-binding transcriptional ArsR family regulator